MGKENEFMQVINHIRQIHEKANKDSSGNFLARFRMAETMGVPSYKSALVKVTQDLSPILSIATSGNAETAGTLIDSLTAMAMDAIYARILLEETLSNGTVQKSQNPPKQRRRRKSGSQVAKPPVEGASSEAA